MERVVQFEFIVREDGFTQRVNKCLTIEIYFYFFIAERKSNFILLIVVIIRI